MDLTTTNTTITTSASVKTPEAEAETPTRIQPSKVSSFSNGVLKRHHPAVHHHFHHRHPSFNNSNLHLHQHAPLQLVSYKECLKNHAASLGGHAVDGCGEFMPSPTATPTDPTSLKCAACGCHRNFHRREPEEPLTPAPNTTAALEYQPHHRHHPPPPAAAPAPQRSSGGHSSPSSLSPPPISSSYYPSAPHMLLALSAGLSGPPQDSNNIPITPTSNAGAAGGNPNGRKRFRTKFTPDQKERMLDFAEKVGWKIQKRDEDLIGEFCNEIGVDKGVLKVWMHNNKNTFGKRSDQANISSSNSGEAAGGGGGGAAATTSTDNGNGMEFTIHYHRPNHENDNDNKDGSHNNHDLMHHHSTASAHLVVATNGSSSSS